MKTIKVSFKVITLSILTLITCLHSFGQSCQAPTAPEQLHVDLYPHRTINVTFHYIHRDSIADTTNVENNALGAAWTNRLVDTVNVMLANLGNPNYFNHTSLVRKDAKIRIKKYGVYHHVDAGLWEEKKADGSPLIGSAHLNQCYSRLVTNNSGISTNDKEKSIHIFYYGNGGFYNIGGMGGRATGFGDRRGIRFDGRLLEYRFYQGYDTHPDYGPYDFYKIGGNFIHEILHLCGLYHNLLASGSISDDFLSACDYVLPQSPATKWKFGDPTYAHASPYKPNNYMYKYEGTDTNYAPGFGSMTYCQIQRVLFYVWNYGNYSYNHNKNVSQTLTSFSVCNDDYTAEILSDLTLDYPFKAFGDITVKSGATFTIECTLEMPNDAKIYVEPGANLVVDGGTITKGCSDFWGGIVLLGDTVSSQFFNPGVVNTLDLASVWVKNNSRIEYAKKAIYRKSKKIGANTYIGGGIVKIEDSDMINNQVSVYMEPFEGIYPATNIRVDDISYIKNTDFALSVLYPSSTYAPKDQVFLLNTSGVTIKDCKFFNNLSNASIPAYGVMVVNGSGTIINNEFTDLREGIRIVNTYKTKPLRVEQNTFEDCRYGTYSSNADNSLILDNTFDHCNYGSYIEASKGFTLSENTYQASGFGVGIWAHDLSAASNEIYKNNIDNTCGGIVADGNTPWTNQGLSLKCNKSEPNNVRCADLWITGGTIDKSQGNCRDFATNAPVHPAGNEFSHKCIRTDGDMEVWQNQTSKIVYSYHYQVGAGPYRPDCHSTNNVQIIECLTQYDENTSCPTKFNYTGSKAVFSAEKNTIRSAYNFYKDEFNTLSSNLTDSLDGGDSVALKNDIDVAVQNGNSVNTVLLSTSPYISDEILHYCMFHNSGLVSSDLYNVLSNYSPLSLYLADLLPEISSQLTSEQMDNLLSMQDGLSQRDIMENNIRFAEQQTELALNELMRLFLYDTTLDTINQPIDSMLVYLSDWNSNGSKEQMIKLYWQKEDFSTAQSLLNELSGEENYATKVELLQKMHDVLEESNDLSALLPDTNYLDSLALDTNKMGYTLAQSVMLELTGKRYPDSLLLPGDSLGSRSAEEHLVVQEQKKLEDVIVYPNPNKGSFVLRGLTTAFAEKEVLHIELIDIVGRTCFEKDINALEDVELTLPQNINGSYTLVLKNGLGKIKQLRIIVNE